MVPFHLEHGEAKDMAKYIPIICLVLASGFNNSLWRIRKTSSQVGARNMDAGD